MPDRTTPRKVPRPISISQAHKQCAQHHHVKTRSPVYMYMGSFSIDPFPNWRSKAKKILVSCPFKTRIVSCIKHHAGYAIAEVRAAARMPKSNFLVTSKRCTKEDASQLLSSDRIVIRAWPAWLWPVGMPPAACMPAHWSASTSTTCSVGKPSRENDQL